MLRFIIQGGESFIYDDCSSEDGWIFKYDATTKQFHVWDDVGQQIDGQPPYRCATLEEVHSLISTFS